MLTTCAAMVEDGIFSPTYREFVPAGERPLRMLPQI
jgi:hypothetical protein